MYTDLSRTVFVFDLDDTLYCEEDYVDSGIRYVCSQINSLYGVNCYETVQQQRMRDRKIDWLEFTCTLTGLQPSAKESLLWLYRLHSPEIFLSDSCFSVLEKIRSAAAAVAVLTDGRTITQKLKLAALGLSDWPAYISEDYGSSKPSADRFLLIQKDFPADQYVYIADNVQKDFIGCNPLGWLGVGMRGNNRNTYSQSTDGLPAAALPAYWVNSWEELSQIFFNS